MIARANWIDTSDPNQETREHKNDIWFEDGGFAMCSGKEAYAQTIEAVIKTVYGEIQVDREYGIPYFSTIWTSARAQDRWAIAVRSAVNELEFVESIDAFTYSLDPQTHVFNYSLTVTTTDGTTVVVNSAE